MRVLCLGPIFSLVSLLADFNSENVPYGDEKWSLSTASDAVRYLQNLSSYCLSDGKLCGAFCNHVFWAGSQSQQSTRGKRPLEHGALTEVSPFLGLYSMFENE